jgi:hypothetical protein
MRFRLTSSREADLRNATPTAEAEQQVFSSDRKRFIALPVKMMLSQRSGQTASVIAPNKSRSAKLSPAFTRRESP